MMTEGKNNIFVLNLSMENQTPEEIAREAALKIIEITDNLIEQQKERRKEKS